ncbi:hypothetical protein MICRO8M_60199 [Microbacterium sp. 8M]|nr:hypothetical protein MICRO8M_60199 [Microbacterium sp. 8M]
MREHVSPTVIGGDEAEALLRVEPLNRALSHVLPSCLGLRRSKRADKANAIREAPHRNTPGDKVTQMLHDVTGPYAHGGGRMAAAAGCGLPGNGAGPHRGGSDGDPGRPEGASENSITHVQRICPPKGGQIVVRGSTMQYIGILGAKRPPRGIHWGLDAPRGPMHARAAGLWGRPTAFAGDVRRERLSSGARGPH